jgi:hypothetical protein
MRDLIMLFIHLIAMIARLLGPGGMRSVVAESLLVKHQLLILNRSRQGQRVFAQLPLTYLAYGDPPSPRAQGKRALKIFIPLVDGCIVMWDSLIPSGLFNP